ARGEQGYAQWWRQRCGPGQRRGAGASGEGATAPGSGRGSQRSQPLREAGDPGSWGPRVRPAGGARTRARPPRVGLGL
ncbi:cyclin-dependent kinase 4 inhibitor B isoform 2, partial [Daubentonia madagascariensis]